MSNAQKTSALKVMFGLWMFICTFGLLRATSPRVHSFMFGSMAALAALVMGAVSFGAYRLLSSGKGLNDTYRLLISVVSFVTAFGMTGAYITLGATSFSQLTPYSAQVKLVIMGLIGTAVYGLWNNDLIRPITLREIREADVRDSDPTRIEMNPLNRFFYDQETDMEKTMEIPVVTGGTR